jgi:hypothetical protein
MKALRRQTIRFRELIDRMAAAPRQRPGALKLCYYALAGSVLFTTSAYAQFTSHYPTPEIIANADKFQPPRLTHYAARLAQQPDMTGTWLPLAPKDACGWVITVDPVHTVCPGKQKPGESVFSPFPGTYVEGIPYNDEYQKKYKELVAETVEGKSRDNFPACFPYGVPRMQIDTPVPLDIIQSPDVMLWYNNYGRTNRRIYLNDKHQILGGPTTGGTGPSYSGDSIGHWEGNTLVVDTVNMVAGYFDDTPAPYSDQLHMVERIRLIATNFLEVQMTFTDPVTMVNPWQVTRYFERGEAPEVSPIGQQEVHLRIGSTVDNKQISRYYLTMGDRPCVPNVRMVNGFQEAILPQEIETQSPVGVR